MNIAHIGALHHRRIFKKYGQFDTSYKISADYEFLMRCGEGIISLYINVVTALMLNGGVSSGCKGMLETYTIQRRHMPIITALYRYWLAHIKFLLRPLLRGY
jgi:hypothetical protein